MDRDLTTPEIIKNVRQQSQSLAGVLQHQCEAGKSSLLRAASLIQNHKRILITGMGASLFSALPLEYFLCSQGFDATAIEAGELLHYLNSGPSDMVVIMVSRSGSSVEIAKLIELLSPANPIIGVTNEPDGPLARVAHTSILIGSQCDEMVAIQTYTGTVLALYLLGCAVTNKLDNGVREASRILPHFSELVSECLQNCENWDSFLDPRSPVHLLARGSSMASAFEGALLFNEVAKHPSCAMPVASFRHGPVEQVDSSFRALLFAGSDRTRNLNLALARDIKAFGGGIRVIGNPQPDDPDVEWSVLPDVPEPLLPLFEIVPLQLAAVRMAQLRGLPLGVFRYAPQVALDETRFGNE